MAASGTPKLWLKLLLAAASVLLALSIGIVVIESFFWVRDQRDSNWHDPSTRFDPEIGWAPLSSHRNEIWGGVTTNSLGFRSTEPQPGRAQILWAGDSVAWGYGVRDRDTAAHQLDALVSSLGYQVQNLGVSGYGTDQQLLFLERHIGDLAELRWVVAVLFPGNDLYETASNSRWGKRKPLFVLEAGELVLTGTPIWKFTPRNVLSNSAIAGLVTGRSPKLDRALGHLVGDRELAPAQVREVVSELLLRMRVLVENRGAHLLLVLSPEREDFDEPSASFTWLRSHVDEAGFTHLDLLEWLRARSPYPQRLYLDPEHYDPAGNRLVAEAVFERLDLPTSTRYRLEPNRQRPPAQ